MHLSTSFLAFIILTSEDRVPLMMLEHAFLSESVLRTLFCCPAQPGGCYLRGTGADRSSRAACFSLVKALALNFASRCTQPPSTSSLAVRTVSLTASLACCTSLLGSPCKSSRTRWPPCATLHRTAYVAHSLPPQCLCWCPLLLGIGESTVRSAWIFTSVTCRFVFG